MNDVELKTDASGESISDPPLVSISVTTYQHAPYLAQCLHSILMQDCPFAFEVLLGEDGSTDGTREIAQRYARSHPDKIRLFLHERHQMIRIDGRPTGRHNFLNNLRHARGRYLCHIDGDDRWTDPQRLRMMVEKMEAEPDLGLAFHNAWNVWPDGKREPYMDPAEAKQRFTRRELTVKNFIPTSGVIWRWNALEDFPEAFHTAPFGDWALNIHFAGGGGIGYVDAMMSERTVHAGGAMSIMGNVLTFRGVALAYEVMHAQIGDDLAPGAWERWKRQLTDGFDTAFKAGDMDNARWFLRHAAKAPGALVPLRTRSRWWGLIYLPRLMRWYGKLRA